MPETLQAKIERWRQIIEPVRERGLRSFGDDAQDVLMDMARASMDMLDYIETLPDLLAAHGVAKAIERKQSA